MRAFWFVLAAGLVGCSSGLEAEPKVTPQETVVDPADDEDLDDEDLDDEDLDDEADEEPTRPEPEEDEDDELDDEDDTTEDDLDDVDTNEPVDTTNTTTTCGAPGAFAFDVIVHDVVTLPYKEIDEPWDWDGDVSDWLVDGMFWIADTLAQSNVDDGWVTAADYAAEILALTDEWAGTLLTGSVPPDLFVSVYAYDGSDVTWEFGETPTVDNSIHGNFATTFDEVFLLDGENLYLMTYDEDLLMDDFAGGWYLTVTDLQDFADCGTVTLSSGDPNDPLQAMDIEIVSVY